MYYQTIHTLIRKLPLVLFLTAGMVHTASIQAQTITVQGSVIKASLPGDSTKVIILGKPSAELYDVLFENINICISIPYQGPDTPAPKVYVHENYMPSLSWIPGPALPEIIGDRAYYTFIGNDNDSETRVTWSAATDNPVVLLSFKEGIGRELVQLNDLTNGGGIGSGGGGSGQSFWYVQANVLGDITDYVQKYYQSTGSEAPVNGGTSAPSAVETIELVALPVPAYPESANWLLYPNPASGAFQLLAGGTEMVWLRLYNPMGQLVWEQKTGLIQAELSAINPGRLTPGTYFFEVHGLNGRRLFGAWLVMVER
ncbi:MAG: T9SS type A sorting domain-containing protein [Bacteroidetes bacterium]|nr:MAG: T9SS type A sorting domain-containing protein [Bacteroidota bacterium]